MFSYVARQPILDRNQQIAGYELLFRESEKNTFPIIDANEATCRLVLENYMSIGDNRIFKGPRNFINFPQACLVSLMPLLLPKNKVVIEILETCTPDEELFDTVKYIHSQGYKIALDDFEYDPRWQRFFPYIHIIKLDLLMLGIDKACDFVVKNRHLNVKFLAEKVETLTEYQQVFAAGFDFFQGYYFSYPEILKSRKIVPSELTTIKLLQALTQKPIDLEYIETIIRHDVFFSYLLIRYVNTINKHTIIPISSFHQALAYIGEDKLQMFVGIVATAQATLDKPKALYVLSLQRAKMCEQLAIISPLIIPPEQAFLVGMFSLLDALLDKSLDELLVLLQLQPAIQEALLYRQGELGNLLNLIDAFENQHQEALMAGYDVLALSEEQVIGCYNLALEWSEGCTETFDN